MDTPLAGPERESGTGSVGEVAQASAGVNPYAIAGIILAAAVASGFIFFIWKRKKKDSEDEPESQE